MRAGSATTAAIPPGRATRPTRLCPLWARAALTSPRLAGAAASPRPAAFQSCSRISRCSAACRLARAGSRVPASSASRIRKLSWRSSARVAAACGSAGGCTGFDPERLGSRAFQPGEYQRCRSALQGQPQAGRGQVRAEGTGTGLQVDAAEAAAPVVDQGQARSELGQGRRRPSLRLRQLSAGQVPQQASGQRHPGPVAGQREYPPGLGRLPARDQGPRREELGQGPVVGQAAVAQPGREHPGLGRDGHPAACGGRGQETRVQPGELG